MVIATDLFHMMDPSGAPQNVNFDEPVATFDARYVLSGAEAPVGAEYVVISLDADLTDERVLTGTANQIAIADGGAGGNVTLSAPQDIHTAATPEFDGVIIGSADGIDCNPGADIDTDLISVGVTGNPLLKWDESENAFDFSAIIALPTTTSTVGQIKQNGVVIFHSYGTDNFFFGPNSGNFTLTDTLNIGFGKDTLVSLTSGQANLAIGSTALESLTEGIDNVAVGVGAMNSATTGTQNVAIATNALFNLTTGGNNVALGKGALQNLTTANQCFGLGLDATKAVTTGWDNIGVGAHALRFNQTGTRNIAIGTQAGYGVATNSYSNNVIIGYKAGVALTTGGNNVLLGYQAGNILTTGAANIIIGYDIDPSAAGASNEINIGDLIKGYLAAHGSGPAINLMGGTPQAQQAHIVDADGTLADITTKFNTLLADLEGFGLLAAA